MHCVQNGVGVFSGIGPAAPDMRLPVRPRAMCNCSWSGVSVLVVRPVLCLKLKSMTESICVCVFRVALSVFMLWLIVFRLCLGFRLGWPTVLL